MHPAPTVHTFNKPKNGDRDEYMNYTIWSSTQNSISVSFQNVNILYLQINLQLRIQCVILLLLKLFLVYRSEINEEGV